MPFSQLTPGIEPDRKKKPVPPNSPSLITFSNKLPRQDSSATYMRRSGAAGARQPVQQQGGPTILDGMVSANQRLAQGVRDTAGNALKTGAGLFAAPFAGAVDLTRQALTGVAGGDTSTLPGRYRYRGTQGVSHHPAAEYSSDTPTSRGFYCG